MIDEVGWRPRLMWIKVVDPTQPFLREAPDHHLLYHYYLHHHCHQIIIITSMYMTLTTTKAKSQRVHNHFLHIEYSKWWLGLSVSSILSHHYPISYYRLQNSHEHHYLHLQGLDQEGEVKKPNKVHSSTTQTIKTISTTFTLILVR